MGDLLSGMFGSMMKEEWRVHSSIFGSAMFALFPLVVALFAFIGSLLILTVFRSLVPAGLLAMLVHYGFFTLGMGTGAFGLFGREVMNRRFGQVSLIAYSSRTLPVSERTIIANFVAKDALFYFLLWILPSVAGFALASSVFLQVSLTRVLLLLLTVTLSFLTGLALSFFLSTIYAHSGKLLTGILALFAIMLAVMGDFDMLYLLPPLSFFVKPSAERLLSSVVLIAVTLAFSLAFLNVDYPVKTARFKNHLAFLSEKLKFFGKQSIFVSKDILDLHRSEAGMGKIIFSFAFPMALAWAILFLFLKFFPFANILVMFSILLGIISSSIYQWLTEFDLFTSYSFLPVEASTVMNGKITSYAILNSISLVILVMATFMTGQFGFFLPALFSFLSVSSYILTVTIYLTGFYPNILLYNATILAEYMFSIFPVIAALLLLSGLNPFYLLLGPLLIPVSFFIIVKGAYKKWGDFEHPNF